MSLKLTEKDFDKLVKQMRKDHPKLKIRVFKKKKRLSGGANGEYGWGKLDIACGPENPDDNDWAWRVGVLAHEYAHYLREGRHSAFYNKKTYRATSVLYSPNKPREERERALYWVLRDEYYTDCEAWLILKKWGLEHYFRHTWWKMAAVYNYVLKFYCETGMYLVGVNKSLKSPNRKFSFNEIIRPLSEGKKAEMMRLSRNIKVKVDKDD